MMTTDTTRDYDGKPFFTPEELRKLQGELKQAEAYAMHGRAMLVHKPGAPGSLRITSKTGHILSPPDERPDWCEGLVVALTAERAQFYLTRLGRLPNDSDGLIAFDDLGWVAVDAYGELMELEASSEYRMDAIAEALGVNRSADLSSTAQDDTTSELAHVLTSRHVGETATTEEEAQAVSAEEDDERIAVHKQ